LVFPFQTNKKTTVSPRHGGQTEETPFYCNLIKSSMQTKKHFSVAYLGWRVQNLFL